MLSYLKLLKHIMPKPMKPDNNVCSAKQLKGILSPVACTTTSACLSSECPSPDEFYCFDIRCYVTPLPVITAITLPQIAADAPDDNTSTFERTDTAASNCQRQEIANDSTALVDVNAMAFCNQTESITLVLSHDTTITKQKRPIVAWTEIQS